MANHLCAQEGLRAEKGRVPFQGMQPQGGGHIRDTHQITDAYTAERHMLQVGEWPTMKREH